MRGKLPRCNPGRMLEKKRLETSLLLPKLLWFSTMSVIRPSSGFPGVMRDPATTDIDKRHNLEYCAPAHPFVSPPFLLAQLQRCTKRNLRSPRYAEQSNVRVMRPSHSFAFAARFGKQQGYGPPFEDSLLGVGKALGWIVF